VQTRRHVGGHGEGSAASERVQCAPQRIRAAAVPRLAPGVARAAHHAHAEALKNGGKHLGIAVARYDDGDIGFGFRFDHGQHHELPVPHGEDLRVLGKQLGVDVGRVAQQFARAEDETDIGLREHAAPFRSEA